MTDYTSNIFSSQKYSKSLNCFGEFFVVSLWRIGDLEKFIEKNYGKQ